MRKLLSLILLVVLTVGAVSTAPTRTAVAASSPSLASVMPADVLVFAEFRTSDFTTTVNRLADIARKAGAPVPENLYTDIDKSLTQALGRPATFEKDILGWVGDYAAVGVRIDPKVLVAELTGETSGGKGAQPEVVVLISVKDEAAADAFFKDVMAVTAKNGQAMTATKDTVGGEPVTIYANPKSEGQFARWKGYAAFGSSSTTNMVLDTLKNNKPTLADDPIYKKVMRLLKPDNLATVYTRSQLTPLFLTLALTGPRIGNTFSSIVDSLNGTLAPTPSPTPKPTVSPERVKLFDALLNYGSSAAALRFDDKAIALDFANVVNADAEKTIIQTMGLPADFVSQMALDPLSGKMADHIPGNVLAVGMGSGISKIYHGVRSLIAGLPKFMAILGTSDQPMPNAGANFAQFEQAIKTYLNLDVEQDVVSWMGGEFAAYMVFNPASDLGKTSRSQTPFDAALLIQSSDAAKTTSFITKLNVGLTRLAENAPTSVGENLFIFKAKDGSSLGYGIAKDFFVLANPSGLTGAVSAINGDGVLSSNPVWKDSMAVLPDKAQAVGFVNLVELANIATKMVQANSSDPGSKQALALVQQFKSVIAYGSSNVSDGTSVGSIQLLFK